ncbi:MAG: ATP-grasp domain-containing protein [Candidatus Zixiibacteriota bacterium]
MPDRRVLVVGTTPDYIAYIDKHYPGRALFLTDTIHRTGISETVPDASSEIVTHLSDSSNVPDTIENHLKAKRQSLSGVVCYDCEWLILAATLAEHFDLSFPSVESVRLSRDKYLSKIRWLEKGIRCPRVELINNAWQVSGLTERIGGSVVLKPLTGSGSELTFLCHDNYDSAITFRAIREGLLWRSDNPLYKTNHTNEQKAIEPVVLAEEFFEGREYSADFIIADTGIQLIRVAKKLRDESLPFGTTAAYVVPAKLPEGINHDELAAKLFNAAEALGLDNAVCMADFIINKNDIVILELTPRIGGDCLPPLIRHCCGLDTIGLAFDLAEGRRISIPSREKWRVMVGLRLFASDNGTLRKIDCTALNDDPRVKEIYLKRIPGHEIALPPDDYDSRILGHVIFEPHPDQQISLQCDQIKEKISIIVEQYHDQELLRFNNEIRRIAQAPDPQA